MVRLCCALSTWSSRRSVGVGEPVENIRFSRFQMRGILLSLLCPRRVQGVSPVRFICQLRGMFACSSRKAAEVCPRTLCYCLVLEKGRLNESTQSATGQHRLDQHREGDGCSAIDPFRTMTTLTHSLYKFTINTASGHGTVPVSFQTPARVEYHQFDIRFTSFVRLRPLR